ncbi:MAG TPA: Gfo/Idh/MocA family oxidoreductase [Victivallales bacterium]|nr:Gfo/Idh/MocA family oxidoreductase [Victivallales bacterium]HRR29151.1 Gfo/Idh/MocA family oxidoreductase [Victivallales bacterium]HRU01352.1 Gfo/Idh/MocA family oxidoreductase [Victivallales bacterium]
MKIGIIGCGNISNTYLKNAAKFKDIELVACADIKMEAAQKKAEEFNIKALSVDEILSDSEIELIVNLTVPQAHTEVNLAALKAGKHVYCEKPFALDLDDASKIVELAKKKKLRVGSAPDTFLGAGYQTCRKIIDDGKIGKPIAGTVVMLSRGPEKWHPNAPIFYQKGAGPMFDIGPYYVTALVSLLGPAKSVIGYTSRAFNERIGGAGPYAGKKFKVDAYTHYSGSIEFHNGALINLAVSFDIYRGAHNPIEIYGTEGSIICPDPNTFGGPVKLYQPWMKDWVECNLSGRYSENSRILGAADMASAIKNKRLHRCSDLLARHVLEIMLAFEESSKSGEKYILKSKCDIPVPMDSSLAEGVLD